MLPLQWCAAAAELPKQAVEGLKTARSPALPSWVSPLSAGTSPLGDAGALPAGFWLRDPGGIVSGIAFELTGRPWVDPGRCRPACAPA